MENKDFLQVSELPAHHGSVLLPELKQRQVTKGLVSCRNCPSFQTVTEKQITHADKETTFCTAFIYALISIEVEQCIWLWIFFF